MGFPIDNRAWLDGQVYPSRLEGSRFGRVSQHFSGWGELRKQKKAPHVEVLYVWALHESDQGQTFLALRSINNCSNDQLQDAIKLVGVRLEQHSINQQEAEYLLDLCYAELQRRMEWTDRVKENNVCKQPPKPKGNSHLEGST